MKDLQAREIYGTIMERHDLTLVILGSDRRIYRFTYHASEYYNEFEIGTFIRLFYVEPELNELEVSAIERATSKGSKRPKSAVRTS